MFVFCIFFISFYHDRDGALSDVELNVFQVVLYSVISVLIYTYLHKKFAYVSDSSRERKYPPFNTINKFNVHALNENR